MKVRPLAPTERLAARQLYGCDIFAPDDRFTQHWWHGRITLPESAWYLWGEVDGGETVRAEVTKETVDLSPWSGAPDIGAGGLEITFLEVAADRP